ncbi:MAG: hypothetical protein U0002_21965 [Thermoanaerobaculia bacterium]
MREVGPLERTEWVVRTGPGSLDRFTMTRLTRRHGGHRGIVLLLPPLGNPFGFFETDESGDPLRSFAGELALRGYEVWGYSPRETGLSVPACESGAEDCSVMNGWGIAGVAADVELIRREIARLHPHEKPIVGGFSLGAMTTTAVINSHPEGYRAAMFFEGALYSADPAIRARNAVYCAQLEATLAAGIFYDGQTQPGIRFVAQLAATDPDGLSPLPGLPPGTTNHQALVAFLSLPQDGPLWPTPGYVRVAGSVAEDRFFFASDERVFVFSSLFNDYSATRTIRDVSCSLAGESTFTGNLGAFTGPVYLLEGGLASVNEMEAQADLLGSSRITRNFIPEFGHADHWFARAHRRVLEADVLRWLRLVDGH